MTKAKATMIRCPHCRQTLSEARFGVHLRPIWLRIVDAITRAGPNGISRPDLTEMIYGDTPISKHVISAHVTQINYELGTRGYQIAGGRGGYRIKQIDQVLNGA